MKLARHLNLHSHRVREAFSRSALRYDANALLQQEIGLRLLTKGARADMTGTFLDVGMGTGWLTRRLSLAMPEADVIGLDVSPGMVHVARQHYPFLPVVQADAADLPFGENSLDGIFSNLAYQWVADLGKAFCANYKSLKPGGTFVFSLFGKETLRELFSALDRALSLSRREGAAVLLPRRKLPGAGAVQAALEQAGFINVSVEREIRTEKFHDFWSLLHWLKAIGANRGILKDYVWGRQQLKELDKQYEKYFRLNGAVAATFEVIWGKGRKSHGRASTDA